MNFKLKVFSLMVAVFSLIGTAGMIGPNCMGWFYAPEMPAELKEVD